MARRRSGFAKTIDFKEWDALPAIRLTGISATTVLGGSLAFGPAGAATILRIRGEVVAQLETPAANEVKAFGIGIGVFSTDAVALGATAMPDPLADVGYPWIYWSAHVLMARIADGATSPADQAGTKTARIMIDSKAMRKVRPDQSVAIVVEPINLAGTATMELAMGPIRVLIGR